MSGNGQKPGRERETSFAFQTKIRQNAEEMQDYVSDLRKWEQSVQQRGGPSSRTKRPSAKKNAPPAVPVRAGGGTVPVQLTATAACDDQSAAPNATSNPGSIAPSPSMSASLAASIPAPLDAGVTADPEAAERERGNGFFRRGDWLPAVKCYTRCLGLKSANYVAFSNRAMAFLKLKEFTKAEMDCSVALQIEPTHAKSLRRRAAARTALGKHRAALADLLAAEKLTPGARDLSLEVSRAREALKTAMQRSPKRRVVVKVAALPSFAGGGTEMGQVPRY